MNKWMIISILIGIIALGLLGGLIYVVYTPSQNDTSMSDDVDNYIRLLRTDYDTIITGLSDAEIRIGELTGTIDNLERSSGILGTELNNSIADVKRLIAERERQRLVNKALREELERSKENAGSIGERGTNIEKSIKGALEILNGLEAGSGESERDS